MKILFDLTALQPSQGKFHGAGEYGKSVFFKILELKTNEVIEGFYNPDEWLDPEIFEMVNKKNIHLNKITNNKDIDKLIKSKDYNVLYSALPYKYYNIDFSSLEFIYTLHGLRDLEMPTDKYEILYKPGIENLLKYCYKHIFVKKYFKIQKERFQKLLENKSTRSKILVDSYHSKYSLLTFYPFLNNANIQVLYPPAKQINKKNEIKNKDILTHKFSVLPKKYFLILSGDRWIKNSYRAVKALDELYTDFTAIDIKTLVIGIDKPGLFKRNIKNIDKFIFSGYVESSELELLYQKAFAFVYPTLNEGFGYPPIECMKYGTPVICSSATSLTEVCENSVIYFNPFDINEIKNRILFIVKDNYIYEKYTVRAKTRYKEIQEKQNNDLKKICNLILKK